jgi:TetR/AcrR family transcriptional regulator
LLTIWLNYMVKTKDQTAEQKILDAAQQVFFDKGMDGARMQDIADKAGINKAMLHYYFRSKEKLFEKIFAESFNDFFPRLASILESDKTIFSKIESICVEYITHIQTMPYLPIFILNEVNRQPDTFLKKIWSNTAPPAKNFFKMVETAIQKKEIKKVHPLQLLMNIISLCIFPFAAKPLFQQVTGISKKQFEALIEERKKIVPQIIIQSLKK